MNLFPDFILKDHIFLRLKDTEAAILYNIIRKPSLKEFTEYQKAAGGRIIQVTIAPELEGAMEFIKDCAQRMGLLLQ